MPRLASITPSHPTWSSPTCACRTRSSSGLAGCWRPGVPSASWRSRPSSGARQGDARASPTMSRGLEPCSTPTGSRSSISRSSARRNSTPPWRERWLDAGYAGEMAYMERTRHQRLDPSQLLPGARSVIAVAMLYAPAERAAATQGKIARYAGGRDYHDVIRPRLNTLARFIEGAAGGEARSRAAVDTSAVLERDLAAAAGLGWIGKNTNLIDPDLGSYFFIGVVLTTAELEADAAQADRCGTCRACLDACPTEAFVGPFTLDARRCISYLTIEHRGSIAAELRPGTGDWLFGCDVCQEVCPWNRKAPSA